MAAEQLPAGQTPGVPQADISSVDGLDEDGLISAVRGRFGRI